MKTWTFIDKTEWPERGPWDNEPDKAQWVDEATGLDCLMVRARSHWCGYVGVPEGHRAFNAEYESVDVDVHGGLTFSGFCQGDPEGHGICHVPEAGRPEKVWWLGFDCAHSGDKRPAYNMAIFRIEQQYPHAHDYEQYRDFDYVRHTVTHLARQLATPANMEER